MYWARSGARWFSQAITYTIRCIAGAQTQTDASLNRVAGLGRAIHGPRHTPCRFSSMSGTRLVLGPRRARTRGPGKMIRPYYCIQALGRRMRRSDPAGIVCRAKRLPCASVEDAVDHQRQPLCIGLLTFPLACHGKYLRTRGTRPRARMHCAKASACGRRIDIATARAGQSLSYAQPATAVVWYDLAYAACAASSCSRSIVFFCSEVDDAIAIAEQIDV